MEEFVPGSGIYTVDAGYQRPGLASIHLLVEGDEVAIIDTGTQYSTPAVEQALQGLGKSWASVRYIILTHIHLDHAGGASSLLGKAPQAQVVVHKRGQRHMADPAKLIAGSIAVYGEALYTEMYGQIDPIPEDHLLVPEENQALLIGQRELYFIDTPGHARHHHCIWDPQTRSMFTGDTMGVGYPILSDGNARVLMPSTTPVQFDQPALHESVDKVMSFKPKQLFLTHFGGIHPTDTMIDLLHQQIDAFAEITQNVAEEFGITDQLSEQVSRPLSEYLQNHCASLLPAMDAGTIKQWTEFDAVLNAQGLAHWWTQKNS